MKKLNLLFLLAFAAGKWTIYEHSNSGLFGNYKIRDIAVDNDNHIWCGYSSLISRGLAIYKGN